MILFVLCAMIWHWQMAKLTLFPSKVGIIADFFPPFVSTGTAGDLFLQPAGKVYAIWAIYLGVTLIVPGVGAWLLVRIHDRSLKKSWM